MINQLASDLDGTVFPGWEYWAVVAAGNDPLVVKRWGPVQVLEAYYLYSIRNLVDPANWSS